MKIVDGLVNSAQGKIEKVMANYTKLSMEGVKRNQGGGVKIEEKGKVSNGMTYGHTVFLIYRVAAQLKSGF